jgi:aerobic carbon-monoxide dehydrogenase medium subunit
MKPPPFEYFAPTSVDECLALLAEHGEDAKLLAGGQSLVPLMNLRLAAPEVLIDLNGVGELARIDRDNGQLVIGAMTRHRDVASSESVRQACPLLTEAAALIGYPAIRNRGTMGGSLSHADPAAELPCVTTTLDAEMVVAGPGGRRTIPARDFFAGHFTTVLEPSELLLEVRFPVHTAGSGWNFNEFSRKSGDFALVAVAVQLAGDGGSAGLAIGVGGVGDRPWRAQAAEGLLAGGERSDELLEQTAEAVGAQARERAEGHADKDYRGHVAATLARRALATALERTGR